MTGKRLEELIDGRLQSAHPTPPLVSSAHSPWAGVPVERNVSHDGRVSSIVFHHTELVLVAAGSVRLEYRARRGVEHFVAGLGTVTIWPAGHESRPFAWTTLHLAGSTTELLRIQLDMSALERLAPEDDPLAGRRLALQPGIEDPTLASLMRLLEAEVAAGCPTGRLYGESLSLALAAHVAERYATGPGDTPSREGLARPVLGRVLDYITANLGRDLAVAELATVANMSPHHFSLRFKDAVGVAPHQWVTRARVREAERQLAARDLSVAQVALSLGFASQSHFTDVFRRLTGTTPKRYQQRAR